MFMSFGKKLMFAAKWELRDSNAKGFLFDCPGGTNQFVSWERLSAMNQTFAVSFGGTFVILTFGLLLGGSF